jgi:hypothetical protein
MNPMHKEEIEKMYLGVCGILCILRGAPITPDALQESSVRLEKLLDVMGTNGYPEKFGEEKRKLSLKIKENKK